MANPDFWHAPCVPTNQSRRFPYTGEVEVPCSRLDRAPACGGDLCCSVTGPGVHDRVVGRSAGVEVSLFPSLLKTRGLFFWLTLVDESPPVHGGQTHIAACVQCGCDSHFNINMRYCCTAVLYCSGVYHCLCVPLRTPKRGGESTGAHREFGIKFGTMFLPEPRQPKNNSKNNRTRLGGLPSGNRGTCVPA